MLWLNTSVGRPTGRWQDWGLLCDGKGWWSSSSETEVSVANWSSSGLVQRQDFWVPQTEGVFFFFVNSWESLPFSGNPNVRCLVTFVINTAVTCDVTPRCWVNVYQRYEWTCCFHYQCRSDSSTHIMKRVRSLQLYSASPTRRHFPVNQCIRVSFSAMSWNAYTSVCCLGCAECVIPYVNMAIEDTILLYYWC